METNYITGGGVGASIIIVSGILYKIVNHKRCRSRCGDKTIVASFDIEATTPPEVRIKIPKETKEELPA